MKLPSVYIPRSMLGTKKERKLTMYVISKNNEEEYIHDIMKKVMKIEGEYFLGVSGDLRIWLPEDMKVKDLKKVQV